jgi:hypothetical protein
VGEYDNFITVQIPLNLEELKDEIEKAIKKRDRFVPVFNTP